MMRERDKTYANEDRDRLFTIAKGLCVRCSRHPEDHGDYLQLAHRLRKGLVRKYGKAVVHHPLSTIPSCSTCNQSFLVHNEEERLLVERIERINSGEESYPSLSDYYAELRNQFKEEI